MKTAAPEKKSVKTLKGQLFGAVSMMLVAAIALGTSTYAWFINNRTVNVDNMQLTVSTSTSMLVAVGKQASVTTPGADASWTGYKSVITNTDITGVKDGAVASGGDYADWYDTTNNKPGVNLLTTNMDPASISSRGFLKPITAADANKITFFLTNNHVSNAMLDEFTKANVGTALTDIGMGPIKRIPLKFTSSNNLDVYFGQDGLASLADIITAAATHGTLDAAAMKKQADAIKTALRVAVVPYVDATYTEALTPVIFQFNDGTPNDVLKLGNNTDYSYVAGNANVFPNVDNDTASTSTDSTPDTIKALQVEADGTYPAIKDSDAKNHVSAVAIQKAELPTAPGTGYVATVTKTGSTSTVAAPTATPNYLFQLKADKPRQVDVYIWLEGTDQDCLNAMSSYQFNINLPFCGSDTP